MANKKWKLCFASIAKKNSVLLCVFPILLSSNEKLSETKEALKLLSSCKIRNIECECDRYVKYEHNYVKSNTSLFEFCFSKYFNFLIN